MNEQQAIALVKKTFTSAFDRNGYINFLKNLLNEFDATGARINQGARIPDKFQNYVEKLERVGKYLVDDHEILLFIVYLKNDTSIECARTMQRNFVASYLHRDMKDAALVAFVSKNPADWRFSFIKMEYRYDAEKNKIREEFTPAKRWSFLVGTNEASHTAQRKLVPLMADDEHNPTLADLEDSFNIEKVTKEFFEKYRGLFIRTKEKLDAAVSTDLKISREFESKGIDTVNLAKKLLGQIIFLYYLQKKGWFGVKRDAPWGEGSRNFLRELFDKKHGDYQNFFNDALEHLFYDALRNDRSHEDHYYPKFNCKIPFLNGGLFDPMNNYDWVNTDILLPNELFHNQTKTKDDDEGDGILDIFDRYNFTVKEDEPFEKEVAIDPELLGKIYEKFNAIRPDNYADFLKALKSGRKGDESKFNKQYGVYYTPREIVHYMCQQSLINYLSVEHKENAIENNYPTKDDFITLILKGEQIKEHDERVVVEGRETAAYSFQMPESIRNHAALIDEKLASIKVCDPAAGSGAFPVGMMSEIVRAREALTIYTHPPVLADIPPNPSDLGRKRGVYDFKRKCIENSLYGVDIDAGAVEIAKLRLWLSLVVDEDDIQNIKPLPNLDYKIVAGNSLIGVEKHLFNANLFTELEALKPVYFNATNITQKQETKKKIDSLIDQITDGRAQFDFKIYFSEVFHEKGGFDVVIGNPPYDVYQGDKESEIQVLRKIPIYSISEGGKLNAYKLFLAKSTKLQKPNGILCEIFQNSFLADNSATKLRKFFLGNQKILQLDSFPERDNEKLRVFEDVKMSVCIMICLNDKQSNYEYTLKIWKDKFMSFSRNINLRNTETLKFDIENATIPSIIQNELGVLKKVANNIRLKSYAKCYEGEINLTFHKHHLRSSKSGFAKMIKGAAVQRWLIKDKMSQGEIEYLDKTSYLKENSGKKTTHHKLRRIVMQGITGVDEKTRLKMTILDSDIFCGNSVNYILIEDKRMSYEFLLGLLNSTLLNWYFKIFSTNSNVNGYEVNNLPIASSSDVNIDQVTKLVDRILSAKAQNPQADTNPLEREIDALVYELYGLSEEEIGIVEGK